MGRSGECSSGSENDSILIILKVTSDESCCGISRRPRKKSKSNPSSEVKSSEVDWKKENEELREILRQSQELNMSLQRRYDDIFETTFSQNIGFASTLVREPEVSIRNESHNEVEVNNDNNDNPIDFDVNSPIFDDSHHVQVENENMQGEGRKTFNPARSLQWVCGEEFKEEDWKKISQVEVKLKKVDYVQNENDSNSSHHSVPDQSSNEEKSEEKNNPGKKVNKADLLRDFDIASDGPASDNLTSRKFSG